MGKNAEKGVQDMVQTTETTYLLGMLRKLRLQAKMISTEAETGQLPDMGLRRFLGVSDIYRSEELDLESNTIYKITDEYMCRYILLLPSPSQMLLVGPYMSFAPSREQIIAELEYLGLTVSQLPHLERYYGTVPVLGDDSVLMIIISTYAELLWGSGNAYRIVEVNRDNAPLAELEMDEVGERDDVLMQMQVTERRYAYESEMMETVSKGLTHRAEMMLRNVTQTMMFEQRMADPIRNIKNYIIICNTLMRKAAQQGGVHPLYLDRISSAFAARIELIATVEAGNRLISEMILDYSRLVRKHAHEHYSPVVRKAVTLIETAPESDLGLQHLSAMLNVSAGYLSSLFHKETGKTVTAYVTDVRMETAAHLLRSTQLQVQTVAGSCGIGDVNYFTKVFKRHFGLTPRQYRLAQHRTKKNKP